MGSEADPELVQLQVELRGGDLERLVVVASDLEYLLALPRDRLLTHTEVRLAAGILRRLLIDNQLGALLRTMGASRKIEPAVEATYLDDALSEWPAGWIRTAWAGGATFSGAHHKGFITAAIPNQEVQKYESVDALWEANPLPQVGATRRMALSTWLQSTSVAIKTDQEELVRISRAEVVKYVANKKGGVHFDLNRKLDISGKRRRREVLAHLLDHGLLRVGHLSGPEYEIASMVRAIADSDWAMDLTRAAQEAVGEQLQGDPNQIKVWTGLKAADGSDWETVNFESKESADADG